jgi:acyl-CoA synthetase (NDP forming)
MDLAPIFKPRTMAVIGVSLSNDTHPANVVFNKNNLRQNVTVFPVNPRGGELRGERVYTSVAEIQSEVDLAVIATKAELVPQVLEECIRSKVKGAMVISGGFAEAGFGDLQTKIVTLARDADFPFIGPNCLGVYAPPYVDTFFIPSERLVKPAKGGVALVSQSGGILVDQMIKCAAEGVGVSTAVSIGNKALIKEKELLTYFLDDPETSVITFYIEGFDKGEGREFVRLAANAPKPVIVLKSGKTGAGTKAVSSHTASMAGDYNVFSSAMSQFGIVEAKDEFELVSFAEALSCYQAPMGGRIAVVTGSGGHGALATDACILHGLAVQGFSREIQEEMRSLVAPAIRDIASFSNPIDLTGSSTDEDFVAVSRFLSRREEVDCVMVLLLPYLPRVTMDLGAKLALLCQQEKKPLIAYVPHVEKYSMLVEGFMEHGIPVAHSVEDAIHMAEAMRRNRPC